MALTRVEAPVVAVSPIIGCQAVKGPAAKIMRELGIPPTSSAIARHYEGLIDGLVLDEGDAAEARDIRVRTALTLTLMRSLEDREALARAVLDFGARLATSEHARSSAKRGVLR